MTRDRAGLVLWGLLALGLVAQIAATFAPGMWLWGLGATRFVPPVAGALVWLAAAVSLVPAVGRAFAPGLEALGRAMERWPGRVAFARAMLAAAFVVVLPDRVWLVGDFLWRQTALEAPSAFGVLYPQALPLDAVIHDRLARGLIHLGLDANGAGRVFGAATTAALAVFGVLLARALGFRGVATVVAAGVVFWGGHLALMTGYDKSVVELCVIFLVVTGAAMRLARTGQGGLGLGIALAFALLLHRAAAGLVPGVLVAGTIARAHDGVAPNPRTPRAIVGFALPLVVLAALAPRLIDIALHVDPVHFQSEATGGGALAGLLSPVHLADLLSVTVMLSPLLLTLPLAWAVRDTIRRAPEAWALAACAAPFVLVMPVLHPAGGVFHDWDVYAPGMMLVSLAIAWILATLIDAAPHRSALAAPVLALAIAPTFLWLVHFTDLGRGVDRVRAYAEGPPARGTRETLAAWEYLGFRELDLGRADESAEAFAHAAAAAPSPRVLREWAVAEEHRGRTQAARAIYRRLAERDPGSKVAWNELVRLALAAGDLSEARIAAEAVLRIDPSDVRARRLLDALPPDSSMSRGAATR